MENTKQGYVDSDYLAQARQIFLPLKEKSYALLGDIKGQKVLDVGCGPGLDTLAMADLAGSKGQVIGIDSDAEMIRQAIQKNQCQLSGAEHICAPANHLPFLDEVFDGVRSERLFMHLDQPLTVLKEIVRVTRSGGKIVVVDTDWGSLSAHTGADDIERSLVAFRADKYLPNGYSGRRLYALFRQLGLQNIDLDVHAFATTDVQLWQFLTQDEKVTKAAVQQGALDGATLTRWKQSLETVQENKSFFASINFILVGATVS